MAVSVWWCVCVSVWQCVHAFVCVRVTCASVCTCVCSRVGRSARASAIVSARACACGRHPAYKLCTLCVKEIIIGWRAKKNTTYNDVHCPAHASSVRTGARTASTTPPSFLPPRRRGDLWRPNQTLDRL